MNELLPFIKHKKHIIWDWNGTLLNDTDLVVDIVSEILEQENLPKITREDYLEKFCFPVKEYYRRIGFDFNRSSFENLGGRFIARFHEEVLTCPLHTGAKEFLGSLHSTGVIQSVLSAAQESSLREQIQRHGIEHYFQFIYGLADHHATSKIERGKELIKASHHARVETVLIGDTDHDLEVGKELGIDVVLVADGHQSYDRLKPLHHAIVPKRSWK